MSDRLDLLLINPGARTQVYGTLGVSLSAIEPPLWCAVTAAFVRDRGYTVDILDAEMENLSPAGTAARIAEINPRLAGVIVLGSNPSAASTPKMTAAGELLTEIKKQAPGIITVIGGLHPSGVPELTLEEEDVDYLAQGEGFETILGMTKAVSEGKDPADAGIPGLWYRKGGDIVSNPPAPLADPDELPIAAWDLLPMDRYRATNWHCFDHINERSPFAIIFTSLGCPFNCSYCNIHALYNDKPGIRYRNPEKVAQEIDILARQYGVKNIKFMDELFALNNDHVERLCDLIIEGGYDLNIWAYARVNTVNLPMLKKMKQAGINWVAYGFESASQKVRSGVSKQTDQETTDRAIEMTREAGIYIMGNFIFGLPDDDIETMRETLDMAKAYNFEYVNFYTAMAYPGSELYLEAIEKGIRLPESWHGYGQYSDEAVPMPTDHLSPAEVLRFRDDAFHEYFSNPVYQEMIAKKFGPEVVEHVREMLKHRIHRKYA